MEDYSKYEYEINILKQKITLDWVVFYYGTPYKNFQKPYTLERLCDELWKFNAIYQYMVINWIDINNLTPSQKNFKSVYEDHEREDKDVNGGRGGYKRIRQRRKGKNNK